MIKVEVSAILDDGTVEQHAVNLSRPEPVKTEADVARDAFIDELHALLGRHGVKLVGSGYDDWPRFRGPFGDVDLGEWHEYV